MLPDAMNPVLSEILRTGRVKSSQGHERELSSGISAEEGDWIEKTVHELQAVRTLEVGLWYGISSLFICQSIAGKPGAHHIVMDPNQTRDCDGIGLNNIRIAGYEDLVEFFEQSSDVVLPQLAARGTCLDFAFIDASHLFDYTLIEFFYIDKLLRVGGIVAFDDVSMPAVQKVCRFIVRNRRYQVVAGAAAQVSRKQRLKYGTVKRACQLLPPLKRLIRPELQQPDIDFNLVPGVRYVALRKEAEDSEDTRPWHFYRDF